MLKNGREQFEAEKQERSIDFKPVVKLFTPWMKATCLLAALHPNNQNIAFGLCDLGQGMPEIGLVYLSELEKRRESGDFKVERDLHFEEKKKLWSMPLMPAQSR